MSSKNRGTRRKRKKVQRPLLFFVVLILLGGGTGFGIYHFVNAYTKVEPIIVQVNPNVGVRAQVEEFFIANDAEEMIPIIRCESQFKHYNANGSILRNRAGSSATGVAQILASVHPDPKVLSLYNKRFNTELKTEDFDINTLEGNLGYALMLYELRGTRDWECSKKFRFN